MKEKLGACAMKRVAVGAHLQTLFGEEGVNGEWGRALKRLGITAIDDLSTYYRSQNDRSF